MTNIHTCILATASRSVPVESSPGLACPKCGTIKKSQQRSCCGVGGAWFNNCGGVGNSKFDHTWTEGIRACKGAVSLLSDEAQLQTIAHYKTTQAQQNTTCGGNGHGENVFDCSASKSKITNTEVRGELSKTMSFICLLFIILYSHI